MNDRIEERLVMTEKDLANSHVSPAAGDEGLVSAFEASSMNAARPVEPPPPDAPIKVLVADDDLVVRRLVCHLLRSRNYEVLEASDGAEALQAVLRERPDIVLTDWEMPHIDGPTLCGRIRSAHLPYYVHVLLLTARNTPENVVHGLQSGADDYLTKPVQRAELLARLNTARRIVAANRQTARLARTDSLTGLLTQRSFFEHLYHHFSLAKRNGRPLACAVVDLDYFKRINDVHGHLTGDLVLRTAADVLRRMSRDSDIISRHGGEEFCVLLPDTDEAGAEVWAKRLCEAVAAETIRSESGEQLSVTCSVGVAGLREDTLTAEQLVDQADQALLCAKRAGRNRAVRYLAYIDGGNDAEGARTQADIFEGVTAADVMTPIVSPLRADTPTRNAADFFLRSRITSAPVVDDAGKLVGVLSERDLMVAIATLDGWRRPVSQLMQRQVITYEENTPLRVIYEFLCRVSLRRIIIVRQGVPAGAISRGTLLRWFHCRLAGLGMLPEKDATKAEPKGDDQRELLMRTAQRISAEAEEFIRGLDGDDGDLQARVIATATQLQGLATELLSQSGGNRCVNGAFFSMGANPE
ncbi:MAG: diguanylate cyclase [Thermogutta sp.]